MARRKDITDRFWSKVDRNGPVPAHMPHLGPCWTWTAGRYRKGYGTFYHDGIQHGAHRSSWLLNIGPIPPETPHVLHRCDTPSCVRPDHLWVGTNADNNEDKIRKGRSNPARGDRHGSRLHPERVARGERASNVRLTEADVREIRRRRADGEYAILIARSYGVCEATVTHICTRRNWKHVT